LEHAKGKLAATNLAAIAAARKAGGEAVGVLAVDSATSPIIEEARKLPGLKKVILAANPNYERLLPEVTAPLLVALQKQHGFSHWWAAHTSIGKNILPRMAGLLVQNEESIAPVADVTEVVDEVTFVRPIYAGNAITTVKTSGKISIITVRPTAFKLDETATAQVPTEEYKVESADMLTKWESEELSKSDRPDLGAATIVVSGGRALKSADNFKLIYDLADTLGAAVGASRAAVDAGYVANDLQVGQTGKVVAPKLYIAVGISGAIQHVAGMKDSKTIVAINKDPDAPIFQVADYGLVGDLFVILPELTKKLQQQ
jgi:electron transfer flavoprotein alpha subunit